MTNNANEGHRGRLRQKYLDFGLKKLTEAEILELLLTFGTPRRDCKRTARGMLENFGTLRDVFEADPKELAKIEGAGPNNILAVKLINDIAGLFLERRLVERSFLFNSDQIMTYLRHAMENLPREVFKVIFLDNSNAVICVEDLSEGTITAAYIDSSVLLEKAVHHRSRSVVFAHNHPGGKVVPSREDLIVTRKLVHVLHLAGKQVLEHLIVGRGGDFFSFRDQGLITIYENEIREDYKLPPRPTGGFLRASDPLTFNEIKRKKSKAPKTAAKEHEVPDRDASGAKPYKS